MIINRRPGKQTQSFMSNKKSDWQNTDETEEVLGMAMGDDEKEDEDEKMKDDEDEEDAM